MKSVVMGESCIEMFVEKEKVSLDLILTQGA